MSINIQSLNLDMHTFEWKGGGKTVTRSEMSKPSIKGVVTYEDGTTVEFTTPLDVAERAALQAVLDSVSNRMQKTLTK